MKLFPSFKKKESSGIFIPDQTGFAELKDEIKNSSINGIAEHLGYHPDQAHSYFGNFDQNADVKHVIVEIFTKNIVFVLTQTTVTQLNKRQVDHFLRDFELSEVFDSITTRDILQEGIQNKSLKIDFLSRVLSIQDPDPNGLFYIESIGLYLYFFDGFLVSIQSSDGLSHWAKHFKQLNPQFIGQYEHVAKLYWGNNLPKVINEINIQSDALADLPDGMKNHYIHLHETKFGTINFAMLHVCHYNKEISLRDFREINHGRFQQTGPFEYVVDRFKYEFEEDGTLLNSSLAS
ncbi:hypothetical protein V9K67_24510 [Paraflavisolibacter sp. H34]|uniref:hypothetical protein n=1 Tax=Huijunlia imazamoxiresistens TaxID=3127457 RepID=UPI00301702B6